MSLAGDYARLARVGLSLARHDVVLPDEFRGRAPPPARWLGAGLRALPGGAKGAPGERLGHALERLGPAYIKLGQFLATRPDIFGLEATGHLSRLKDDLPAFPQEAAWAALEAEFPGEAGALFSGLGPSVAAASLAQVHRLETPDGAKAVKILRPGAERSIRREAGALARGARLLERTAPASRRLEPGAFVATVRAALEKELDLRLEAGGTDEMRELDEGKWFLIPEVDWSRSGRRVLTTGWVEGTPLTRPDALEGLGSGHRATLADSVIKGFLSHALDRGVFHADMHEGNMIVSRRADGSPVLGLVDFGIIGRIGLPERRFLAEILWGFLRRDYTRVAEVHFEAGYVPPDRSVGDFAQALRSVGEPIFGKDATEVSMGRLLLQLLDFTHTFGMRLRPELILLQKTMVQVEGVARGIDPSHNIWDAARPVVERWVRASLGPAGAVKVAVRAGEAAAKRVQALPELLDLAEAALIKAAAPDPPRPVREGSGVWPALAGAGAGALATALLFLVD